MENRSNIQNKEDDEIEFWLEALEYCELAGIRKTKTLPVNSSAMRAHRIRRVSCLLSLVIRSGIKNAAAVRRALCRTLQFGTDLN